MKTRTGFAVVIATVLTLVEWGAAEDPAPVARWSFEQVPGQSFADTVGNHAGAEREWGLMLDNDTRDYTLNETTHASEPHGVAVDAGFWPMQEPQRMADGNWIMAGARIAKGYDLVGDLPAVAISHGDDSTQWDLLVIPTAPALGDIWGESTVIVEGNRITNLSRYGAKAVALFSVGEEWGRTWTPSAPSNLPMATSKPYAGILSTGQRYLVCTTTANTGRGRSPLAIAVSKPGESAFSKVFLIRTPVFDGTPGVSAANADFSYPNILRGTYENKNHNKQGDRSDDYEKESGIVWYDGCGNIHALWSGRAGRS